MTYDTAQFYNTALALFAGSISAALAFALLPPPSPALRTRRLLAFALRDLRRCAIAPRPPTPDDWDGACMAGSRRCPSRPSRCSCAQLLAALALGSEMIRLRRIARPLALGPELDAALAALAQGAAPLRECGWPGSTAASRLWPAPGHGQPLALRARASILVLSAGRSPATRLFRLGSAQHEVHGDQSARRLCCADCRADGRGLDRRPSRCAGPPPASACCAMSGIRRCSCSPST